MLRNLQAEQVVTAKRLKIHYEIRLKLAIDRSGLEDYKDYLESN